MTVVRKLPYAAADNSAGVAPEEFAQVRALVLALQQRVAQLESALGQGTPAGVAAPRFGVIRKLAVAAADLAGLRLADVIGPWRAQPAFLARVLVVAEAQRRGFSLSQIGQHLGGRDHTSIMVAARAEARALAYFGLPDGFTLQIEGEEAA